jgi:hypothetical protein
MGVFRARTPRRLTRNSLITAQTSCGSDNCSDPRAGLITAQSDHDCVRIRDAVSNSTAPNGPITNHHALNTRCCALPRAMRRYLTTLTLQSRAASIGTRSRSATLALTLGAGVPPADKMQHAHFSVGEKIGLYHAENNASREGDRIFFSSVIANNP